ncbi:MAG: cupin domain-containing protein [Treponema sp.]|jgi:mannose-6-phosphate isomerase-like protein (cupin superfamily)|nr:cupin domain-containing protein [Treponema sp.]
MAKAYVKNYYDLIPAAPLRHIVAHAFAFAVPATTGTDTYNFFSICEIRFGGAALLDNHKDADHCYFILSGKGYSFIKGKRYEYRAGDVMWIPGNSDHEMYPIGVQTLKFLVTLTGKDFNQTEPYIRNILDVEGVDDPANKGVTLFPMTTPKNGGSNTIDFHVVELQSGAQIAQTSYAESDQNTYVCSGKGYAIVEGEKLALHPEDGIFIPKGAKYCIVNDGKQTLKLAQTFGPARLSLR